MKTETTKWPIVAADPKLVTLEELARRLGRVNNSNLRKWIIRHGFSFALARMAPGNQLTLVVTPEEWLRIKARREALGFAVAAQH